MNTRLPRSMMAARTDAAHREQRLPRTASANSFPPCCRTWQRRSRMLSLWADDDVPEGLSGHPAPHDWRKMEVT